MLVLGIETSCDETGVALYDSSCGLLGHLLHSQYELHADYGGIVPELASRNHISKLLPLIQQIFNQTGVLPKEVTGIAYTCGPGLTGALLVGATVGYGMSLGWNIPIIGIHHMEAHLLATMLEPDPPSFPFLALLISGGHSLLVKVQNIGNYCTIGESLDDAAGEVFDKIARLLELPYPGGPSIAKLAQDGNPNRFKFPRPIINKPGFHFSFSGLKTAVSNTWHTLEPNPINRADVARALEEAVVDTLVIRTCQAIKATELKTLVVAGGVSANRRLREKLNVLAEYLNVQVFYPRIEFCTDNGAMVAYTGYRRLRAGQYQKNINVLPRWALDKLEPVLD